MYGMPTPQQYQLVRMSRDLIRETSYNQELAGYISSNEPLLVPDQTAAYQIMLQKVQTGSGGIAFFDTPGGTGKTSLLNYLLAKVRQMGKDCRCNGILGHCR